MLIVRNGRSTASVIPGRARERGGTRSGSRSIVCQVPWGGGIPPSAASRQGGPLTTRGRGWREKGSVSRVLAARVTRTALADGHQRVIRQGAPTDFPNSRLSFSTYCL